VRVVFDTVVFVCALISPYGWCGRLLFDHAAYQLVVSAPVVTEYLDVLRRPELVRKYRSIAGRDAHAVLDLIANAVVVHPTETPPVCRDPEDDKFLAAAAVGNAAFIVSEDTDLLVLKRHERIAIVDVEAFLQVVQARRANAGS